MRLFVQFTAGVIFALGLGVSGMTQPAKVIGFLDVLGGWDPSLAFVMIGAIGVHFVAYRFYPKMSKPFLETEFKVPSRTDISPQLMAGAALFGVGWGLGGICPGPGIVAATSLDKSMLFFVGAMIIGMIAYQQVWQRVQSSDSQPEQESKDVRSTV
ncbi:MAG: hypothetical protein CMK59_06940 [Proteobacteria bacterium]|nr:hypothetical protein [Pseudomonadota bacterium]